VSGRSESIKELRALKKKFLAKGGCKILGEGKKCPCPLYVIDRAIFWIDPHDGVRKLPVKGT